ncbi:MAG: universal stress protein, partial [Candidatus Binatia bacterium]
MDLARKILIPIFDTDNAVPYLKLSTAFLARDGKVVALKVIQVPEETSLSEGAEKAPDYRAALEEIKAHFPDERMELRTLVRVSHRLSEGILETVLEEACDLLLLPWKGYTASEDRLFGATIDQLLENPPCPVLVVRTGDLLNCRRILLAVRGGPFSEYALEIANHLAIAFDAEVTALHCEEKWVGRGGIDQPYLAFLNRLPSYPKVRRLLTVQGNPKKSIIEEAKGHDMVIVGATGSVEPKSFFLGPIIEPIAQEMQKPFVVVKTPRPWGPWMDDGEVEEPKPLSERVDKWFAENTFHAREFSDLRKLLELKEKQGLTISLGLPALNEAETVGKIIRTLKGKLFEEVPLLDEIVLIDSGSTDNTVKIAQDLDIPVYLHQDILPAYGSYRGKGEALWKSL